MTLAMDILLALYTITYPFRDFPPATRGSDSARCANRPFSLIRETGALRHPEIREGSPAIHYARQMAQMHNETIHSLNSIYNHCTCVKAGTQDAIDFLSYCQSFHETLDCYHRIEEKTSFPDTEGLVEKPSMVVANVEQHSSLEDGLENFRSYVFGTSPKDFDGQYLKDNIDSFGKILERLLHAEIQTLLSVHYLDAKKMEKA